MKTRVIQDDPDGGRAQERSTDPAQPAPPTEPRRPDGALERASPQEGDLRLVRVRGAASSRSALVSPMQNIVYETSGPGESGRADTILYDDFEQPAGETVLIQSDAGRHRPGVRGRHEDVIAGVSSLDAVTKVESPFDGGQPGLISDDEHSVLVALEIARRLRQGDRQDRPRRRRGRRGAEGPSRLLHRVVR